MPAYGIFTVHIVFMYRFLGGPKNGHCQGQHFTPWHLPLGDGVDTLAGVAGKRASIHMCHHIPVTHQRDLVLRLWSCDCLSLYPQMSSWDPFLLSLSPPPPFPFAASFSIEESLWSSRWQNGVEEDVFRSVLVCTVSTPSLPINRPLVLQLACRTPSFPWNTHSFRRASISTCWISLFSSVSWRLNHSGLQKWVVWKIQNPVLILVCRKATFFIFVKNSST